jgi:alkylation response protein AidB-like acyl-CoA dehydrogenase
VDRFGAPEQRARWLPALCRMEIVASYCLTEPGSGSDAAALRTTARADGNGHYVLTGQKAFISGAGTSDVYAVMCRTGGEGPKGVSCLLVEKGTPGLSFAPPERKMGWNSQPTAVVTFEDCRVPAENRLGPEGEGFRYAMTGLDGGRVNIAACSLGGAAWALDAATAHVKERTAFGAPLADLQAVRFKLADMATMLEASRLMVWRAAAAIDAGAPDATMRSAMAKRFATDACFEIVDEALQLHGGYGYIRDYGVELRLRDLRVHRILEGANEIMRVIVARKLLEAA